jgi:beta-glucosidase
MNQNPGEVQFNSFSNGIQRPLWYFGEGLSYTQFEYSDYRADSEANADGEINISLKVKNTGNMDGEEVVQLYFTDKIASMVRPERELAGFARIALKAGEEKQVTFAMKVSQTAFLNEDMEYVVEEGDILLCVGSSSIDIKATANCHIKNTLKVDGATRGFVAKCATAS